MLILSSGSNPGLTFPLLLSGRVDHPILWAYPTLYFSIIGLITMCAPICLLVYIGLGHEHLSGRDSLLTHLHISRSHTGLGI